MRKLELERIAAALGRTLRSMMKKQGLRLKGLSELSGVKHSIVLPIVGGKANLEAVPAEIIIRLLLALGFPIHELLERAADQVQAADEIETLHGLGQNERNTLAQIFLRYEEQQEKGDHGR